MLDERQTEPGLRGVAAALLIAGPLLAMGCGGSAGPNDAEGGQPAAAAAPAYPEGTAFAIGGVPILASDIDEYVPLIRSIDPHVVETSQRRRALTNIVLPLAAAQALDPGAREEAFQRAQAIWTAVRETGDLPADAPAENYLTGTWRNVGMIPFKVAMTTPIGSYSELVETPGAFTFFKYIATNAADPAHFAPTDEITIRRYDVPFLPDEDSAKLIQAGIDNMPIEVIDEEWESIMPPIYLYPKAAPVR